MKKLLLLFSMLILAVCAHAAPAMPGKFKRVQPDGSVITVQLHGDEYYHWMTDEAGNVIESGSDGYFRKVSPRLHKERLRKAGAVRKSAWSSHSEPFPTNFGERKILCILANFSDVTYSIEDPATMFSNMLNQEGYSYDGAHGSVRDYYIENSMGQYRPVFDVYGPVDLPATEAFYDGETYLAVYNACKLLDDQINFADYDTDSNGEIDMILFIFPGYDEAQGGPYTALWSHQWSGYGNVLDDCRITRYFCTSELKGNSGTNMCGIGSTCHEFAHSLGLPDFYDTNGDTDGKFEGLGALDLMSSGNYNDSGRCPPYLNSLERNMLGWLDDPERLSGNDRTTLYPVQSGSKACYLPTSTEGEVFLLECRNGTGWDSYAGAQGLLIYDIDKSDRIVGDDQSAAYLWENTNSINAYGSHPCYSLLSSVNGMYTYEYTPVDWAGVAGPVLSDFLYDGSCVSFKIIPDDGMRRICGMVRDGSGQPLEGAEVVLSQSMYPLTRTYYLEGDIVAAADSDGWFEFLLPQDASTDRIITIRLSGYAPVSANIPADGMLVRQDFVLYPPAAQAGYEIGYDHNNSFRYFRREGEAACGMRFPAAYLSSNNAVGCTISSVTVAAIVSEFDNAYVIIDIGGKRMLTRDISSQFKAWYDIVVDVSDAGIVIPPLTDVYIGIGFTGLNTEEMQFPCWKGADYSGGCYIASGFLTTPTAWEELSVSPDMTFHVRASLTMTSPSGPPVQGVSYIRTDSEAFEVVPAADKTVKEVSWFLDGTAIASPPAPSSLSGSHTLTARLQFYDGTSERVYLDLN